MVWGKSRESPMRGSDEKAKVGDASKESCGAGGVYFRRRHLEQLGGARVLTCVLLGCKGCCWKAVLPSAPVFSMPQKPLSLYHPL